MTYKATQKKQKLATKLNKYLNKLSILLNYIV